MAGKPDATALFAADHHAAVEEARETETWQAFLVSAAYDQRPVPAAGEELAAFALSEYKDLRDYMEEQGTLVKDYDDLK